MHPCLGFCGGTERLVATARALEGQGVEVTVLSTPGSRAPALQQAGLDIRFVELPRDPFESPFAFWRTRSVVSRLKPTILHATDESLAALVAGLARLLKIPYVLEIGHLVRERIPHFEPCLSSVLATSESLVEGIVNHGRLPRTKLRVVRHAPAPQTFDYVPAPEPDGLPRIGCSGQLDGEHNTEWFLEAARTLIRQGRKCSFFILGEGPREMTLRRSIREASLTEHVTLGVPTTAATAQSLGTLDIYVSCRIHGGPSWISCEALAQGVPSIFAAAGEAFHLIRDRHSGVLVEPGDGRRLAEEITLMIDNPDFARTMGQRGKEHLLEFAPTERFEKSMAEAHALASGTAVASAR